MTTLNLLCSSHHPVKEPGGNSVEMTDFLHVQLSELMLILGKIGGQIYTANFFRSLIFIK